MTLAFHASCLKLLSYELVKPPKERLLAKMTHASGLYVADNRMELSERFVEQTSAWVGQGYEALASAPTADWLLQVDTDVEFPVTLIETMIALAGDDRKILAASVPLGAYASCAFRRDEKPGVWKAIYPVPAEPMEVEGIATACALIHREVFETIAEQHGQCWWHHIYLPKSAPGTPLRDFKYLSQGEDIAFSVRAAACGFKLWCAHVPGLGHYKTRRCSHDDERALMYANAAALDAGSDGMGEIVEEG